jgi:hypothetical protein
MVYHFIAFIYPFKIDSRRDVTLSQNHSNSNLIFDFTENFPSRRTHRLPTTRLPIATSSIREYEYRPIDFNLDEFSSAWEEENCFSIIRAQKHIYGSITVHVYKKLLKEKLLHPAPFNSSIYRKIIDVYFINLRKEERNAGSMFTQTKKFLKCIPKLHYILKFLQKISSFQEPQRKNLYFIKLCLDIHETHLKTFDLPLLRNYKKQFLPVAIKFYTQIADIHWNFINEQTSNFRMKNLEFKSFQLNKKSELIEYYKNELESTNCLTEGVDLDKFIN